MLLNGIDRWNCQGGVAAARFKKKKKTGPVHERWETVPREVPDSTTVGVLWAQLAVLRTTIGFFVLWTFALMNRAELSGSNQRIMTTSTWRATSEAVCHHTSDWSPPDQTYTAFFWFRPKNTRLLLHFQASVHSPTPGKTHIPCTVLPRGSCRL